MGITPISYELISNSSSQCQISDNKVDKKKKSHTYAHGLDLQIVKPDIQFAYKAMPKYRQEIFFFPETKDFFCL